jgi:hypothetical protein
MSTFICDPCDSITAVCEHLDARIAYLERIAFALQDKLDRASPKWEHSILTEGDIEDLLFCEHPANMLYGDRGFCQVCRRNTKES